MRTGEERRANVWRRFYLRRLPLASSRSAPTAKSFASRANDLEALNVALVDAASVSSGLWLSYLFVLLYLAIAAGSVSHLDLFFENPVRLPFLGVDLPLRGFFVIGPLLFLVAHAYILLHFSLLSGKVNAFDAELEAQIRDENVKAGLRRQMPSNIFVQFLAGPPEVRRGATFFMLWLISRISLVAGPIALLLLFLLQFLPFHREPISWWHRIAIAGDVALLWLLWPTISGGETTRIRRLRSVMVIASLTLLMLVFTTATFPGEWLDEQVPSLPIVGSSFESLHKLLMVGDVDLDSRRPTSLWPNSNRLILPGMDFIDHAKFDSEAKIDAASVTVSLRARHLEGAVLSGAKLRKADFTAAWLQGARLDLTDLREATFDEANLQGSNFNWARLTNARLSRAHLEEASLLGVQLQGAMIANAQLRGVSLNGAHLQGATLQYSDLQGVDLGFADLRAASLFDATLLGASLNDARLQGASLRFARLQGATLTNAQLEGASLDGAQLQGATLVGAQFRGASLKETLVWRVDVRKPTLVDFQDASVIDPQTERGDWSPEQFQVLKLSRRPSQEALARLDPDTALNGEAEMVQAWRDLGNSSDPSLNAIEKNMVTHWQSVGCAADGAPYLVKSFVGRLYGVTQHFWFSPGSTGPILLACAFLDEEHCPGSHGISEDDKNKLRAVRDGIALHTPDVCATAQKY
jgi:uncharacterized protein YjbI with pentapeptide repeats